MKNDSALAETSLIDPIHGAAEVSSFHPERRLTAVNNVPGEICLCGLLPHAGEQAAPPRPPPPERQHSQRRYRTSSGWNKNTSAGQHRLCKASVSQAEQGGCVGGWGGPARKSVSSTQSVVCTPGAASRSSAGQTSLKRRRGERRESESDRLEARFSSRRRLHHCTTQPVCVCAHVCVHAQPKRV